MFYFPEHRGKKKEKKEKFKSQPDAEIKPGRIT